MTSPRSSPPFAHLTTGEHLSAFSGWLEYQLRNWDAWAQQRDESWLALSTGNPAFPSVGHLMRHAFSPLHRYSDQIAGADPIDDSDVALDDWMALSNHAWRCLQRHRSVFESVDPANWPGDFTFKTRSAGLLTVTVAAALSHAATHCVWHLGGVAHLLRAQGIDPPARSDFIFAAISV